MANRTPEYYLEDRGTVSVQAYRYVIWDNSHQVDISYRMARNPAMYDWLDDQDQSWAWRVGAMADTIHEAMFGRSPTNGTTNCFVEFREADLATLFKLTWGGK